MIGHKGKPHGPGASRAGKGWRALALPAAGRGLPIAVVDDTGRLIGELEPREIMEEMGRVEQLIDGFEREVFL